VQDLVGIGQPRRCPHDRLDVRDRQPAEVRGVPQQRGPADAGRAAQPHAQAPLERLFQAGQLLLAADALRFADVERAGEIGPEPDVADLERPVVGPLDMHVVDAAGLDDIALVGAGERVPLATHGRYPLPVE
jgi:hypothetical protein